MKNFIKFESNFEISSKVLTFCLKSVYNLFLTRDIVVIYTNEIKEASSGYRHKAAAQSSLFMCFLFDALNFINWCKILENFTAMPPWCMREEFASIFKANEIEKPLNLKFNW